MATIKLKTPAARKTSVPPKISSRRCAVTKVGMTMPTMAMLATLPGTVTLRAEYLHYDLQQRSTPLSLFGQNTVVRMRNEGDLGRVGVNYKF